ncbi:MAG TPA: FeoA family protein [Opitutaceae bacterium]|nr:FeoA family protein [Opitutaceae bacterium]
MTACKLSELAPGTSATVRSFSAQAGPPLRLLEMGLLPGTRLTLVRTAPLGDPIEIRLRGYHLSLRKAEASHVLVEPS